MFENETVTNVTNDNYNTNIISELERKEKNKKGKAKFLLIGAFVVIAIAIGLYVGYKKLNNDPMSIYKDSINNVYKYLNDALKENKKNSFNSIDVAKDPVVVKADVKLDSNMPELKNFTGLNYSLEAGMDYANKKMNVGLGVKDSSSSILTLMLSIIDKNIYLKSDELYNKVLDLGEEDIFGNLDFSSYFKVNGNSATFDYDNYSYILKEMKTILIDSIDKNKLSMEKENNAIKKAVYNLDKENMERTLKFFKDRILKDDKLMKAIAESTGVTVDNLKEVLNEEIVMDGYPEIIINLYTDKLNNLIGGSFIIDSDEVIKFDCDKKEYKIEINAEDVTFEIKKDKEDVLELKAYENDTEVIYINLKKQDKENAIAEYKVNMDGLIATGNILVKNYKATKDSVSFGMIFTFNTSIMSKEIDFTIDGNYSVAKTDVKTIDNVGSVKIDNISEEEAMEIFTKLSTILERFGLSDLMGSIM